LDNYSKEALRRIRKWKKGVGGRKEAAGRMETKVQLIGPSVEGQYDL
jgi:hypothetical protein